MKKLLFVLGLVISLFASSQGDRMKPIYNFRGLEIADWYLPPANYVYVNQRYRWFMGMFDSGFHVPTTTVYPTLSAGQWTGAGGLKYRTTDSSFYGYSAYQWTRLASSQSVNQALANCYGLLNGLAVSYLSGLTFDVSPGDFTLGCFNFHSNGGQVTGTAAHATLARIDVVLVDTLGAVSILAGTPAADPSKPQIDPSYQLELTFYTVAALATTPTGVSSVNIYLNNAPEWTATQNNWTASVAADFNSTTDPFEGTKHILISNTGTVGPAAELKFVNGSALNIGDYTVLKFYIKPVSNFTVIQGISLRLGNGTAFVSPLVPVRNGDFGFSRTSNTWQLINIPISAFNATGTQFDRLYIYPISSAKNFYLDVIQLQAGIPQGGTGGSQNLSWNATTHAVDITGGTSAVIPYASTTADGLINFSGSQSIGGNKTFTALTTVSNILVVNSEQIMTGTEPSTPSSGRGHLYALTTDDKLYWKTDGGVVYDLTAGAGGITNLNDIGDATGVGAVAAANNDQTWTFDGLSGKNGFQLTSSTTAASANNQRLFNVFLSGANATSDQFTAAISANNTHTGTGALNVGVLTAASGGATDYGVYSDLSDAGTTNIGYYATVSGATTNYGIWIDAGITRIDGELNLNGSAGTTGQVLTSAGAGAVPTWTTPSGGGGVNAGAALKATYYPSAGSTVDDWIGVEFNNTNLNTKIIAQAATDVILELRSATSQSADLLQLLNSAGDVAVRVSPSGDALFSTPGSGGALQNPDGFETIFQIYGAGNAYFQVTSGSAYAETFVIATHPSGFWSGLGGGMLGMRTNNNLNFITNAATRATITAAGEFLIGTTTDNGAFKLQISGDSYNSGNLLLGGTAVAASATTSLHLFNGTVPSASIANGVLLYSEDVSASAELKVRDEAGNITPLSPHNFTGIPEGRSEEMAWSFYSERDGKYINVDMLKLARLVEKLTGEKLIYTGNTKQKPNPNNK